MRNEIFNPPLSELCTLRVGGKPSHYYRSADFNEIVESISQADRSGWPLLILGGGSNLVPPDAGFEGLVLQDLRRRIRVVEDFSKLRFPWTNACNMEAIDTLKDSDDAAVMLQVDPGCRWDDLVEFTVSEGLVGLEALSGIPGTVGAAPVQNIGAYGADISQVLFGVTTWDRKRKQICYAVNRDLRLGYRDSVIKRSREENGQPTGRWVVLGADFLLRRPGRGDTASSPINYPQLADSLGVKLGVRVPPVAVRQAVLELRQSKGMVLDVDDQDSWSAGSFFVNPVLDSVQAAELPGNAPLYPVAVGETGRFGFRGAMVPSPEPFSEMEVRRWYSGGADSFSEEKQVRYKTSAAWLIENAGIPKGFSLPGSAAGISTKHVLALTNRGGATAKEILDLADHVVRRVESEFGLTLVPEPVVL